MFRLILSNSDHNHKKGEKDFEAKVSNVRSWEVVAGEKNGEDCDDGDDGDDNGDDGDDGGDDWEVFSGEKTTCSRC